MLRRIRFQRPVPPAFALAVCIVLGAACGASAFSRAPAPPPSVVPEGPAISVKFHEDVAADTVQAIFLAEGLVVQRHLSKLDIYVVALAPGEDADDAVRRLLAYEQVDFAEKAVPARPLDAQ